MPIDGDGARRARRLVGLLLLVAGIGSTTMAFAAGSSPSIEVLVEGPGCDAPPAAASPPPPATLTPDGAAVPVVLVIPPTVFIRVDTHGAPDEVTTNTGCAPRPTDRFLIELDGGPEAVGAPVALVDAVMAQPFGGDWRSAGTWHEF